MRSRAFWYALVVGGVSMTSGCNCFRAHFPCVSSHFPNLGWRFHDGVGIGAGGPCCAPGAPIGGGPVMSPECHGCGSGPMAPPTVIHQPAGYAPNGYPPVAYPPMIGPARPLPGATIIPSNELPSPMPVKEKGGN